MDQVPREDSVPFRMNDFKDQREQSCLRLFSKMMKVRSERARDNQRNDQEHASEKHVVVQDVVVWWHLVLQGAVVVGTGCVFEQRADVHGGHVHGWIPMQPVP